VVEEAVAANPTGAGARVVYPFRFPAEPVSFVHLAECAGLGRRSVAGVLVHPVFGPWIALRAAILLPAVVVAERAVPEDFDPCPSCVERACMPACPVGAVGPQGWDVPRCAAHRVSDPGACATRCEARFMCVIGREHRYPAEALAYHQARALPLLATRVGR
jgi:epoxyqueuosine reductase QueG